MTTFFWSQTFAFWPNSRLKTPIVPGPHTSCVIRTSALTQTFSPAETFALPAALAKIFSVNVINRDEQCNSRRMPEQEDELAPNRAQRAEDVADRGRQRENAAGGFMGVRLEFG